MQGIDKTAENEGEKCINCGCKIREDLLQKLRKNRGKERVVCEFCGVELSKIEQSNSPEKRDDEAQLKCSECQMRIFIYRYIYKTLNSPDFIYKILKKQRDMAKSQIDNLAEGIKEVIIQHPFPKEWIESLPIDKNEFIKYHYFLRKALDEGRFYQEQYLPFFRESIPLIFGLIIGKYNLSRIQDAEELVGIEDLKKTFCIHLDTIQLGSFEYYLTILLCGFIYAQIIKSNFNNLTPESDKSKLVITSIGTPVLKMVLFQKLEKQPYFKTLFNKNKELKEEYNRFQSELNYNHIYIDSFIDYLLFLIDMISDVMKGTCPFSKLSEIKREIIVNLIQQDKFETDPRFSPLFRDNLTIILSHQILLRLYSLAEKNQAELQQVEPTETCINELSEDIKQDTITYKEIKQEHLNPVVYMELEVFNNLYQKLREELQKDKIFAERFRFYIIKLITIIVENLDNINLPRSLSLEQSIAPTLNILKAIIVPDLIKRRIIKMPKRLLKKPVRVKDLLKGLNLNAKDYGIIANDKKVSLEDVILPEDRIVVLPYFQGGSDPKTKMTVKEFFRLIKTEIVNILGVKVNYRELSTEYLKMKNKWYVNDRILDSLRYSDYVLPSASLNQFKRNLVNIFKEKGAYFEYIIDLYKSLNPWKHEKVKINSNYFAKIDTLEKAYSLGFLLAEAHVRIAGNNYRFFLDVSVLDGKIIKNFGRSIGFDFRHLKYTRSTKGEKTTRKFTIIFSDKEFCENLMKNGFPKEGMTTKNPDLRFPYWIFTDKKFVMAMLLGYFDGDGTHGFEDSRSLSKEDELRRNPVIQGIRNRQFLQDIYDYFGIDNDITEYNGMFGLRIGKRLFNDLIKNYDKSLERKAVLYNLEDKRIKFMFPKETLKKLIDKDFSYNKIADIHYEKYGIEITWATVRRYAIDWGLKVDDDSISKWKITIKLLGDGWSLEEIFSLKFGYTYSQQNLKNKNSEWFSHDPKVKDSSGKVSLKKIIDIYGNYEKNLRQKVISRRKEGWSLIKIYTEDFEFKYDPLNENDYYYMEKFFKEIFKEDILIKDASDVLRRVEEVYNPINKL